MGSNNSGGHRGRERGGSVRHKIKIMNEQALKKSLHNCDELSRDANKQEHMAAPDGGVRARRSIV